jgi:hypothetical protein
MRGWDFSTDVATVELPNVALIWLHYFNWLLLILILHFLLLFFLLFLLRLLLPLLLALLSLANLCPYQIALSCSRSCYLRLQFLTPIVFRSSPTESSHLHFGFPTCRVPFGLRTASCLQWSSSCILQNCPSHLSLPIMTIATMSSSSQSV